MDAAAPRRMPALRVLAGALATAALLAWPVRHFFLRGQTDFIQLYTGAQLAGTGRLYDPAANYEWHERLFGVRFPAVLHSRPPFYSALLKPLAWLPYRAAYWFFVALNIAAAAWVFWRVLGPNGQAVVLGLLFPATYLAILWGQDVWLAAALFGSAVLLMERNRDFPAGLLLSLCAIKAHLFVLVPVALLGQKRWRALGGGAAGGALLLLLSFAGGGPGWLPAYLKLLASPVIHRDQGGMPNLLGLAAAAGGGPWLLAAMSALAAAAVIWICARRRDLRLALAASLAGGFLLSFHAYPQDAVTLLLAFALLRMAELKPWQAAPWYLLASPIPLYCVLSGTPFHAVLPAVALAAVAALLPLPPREDGTAVPQNAKLRA